MYLTISKRLEFSASYRYYQPNWPEEKNREVFGKRFLSRYGFGSNFVAYFIFHGPVDVDTGMVLNVADVKKRVNKLLAQRFDHKFLNMDTPPFDRIVPSPENIARQLFIEAETLFQDSTATLVACHLSESPNNEATAYSDGYVERHLWTEFSAARRTWSPHLSEEENTQLFGTASSPSGHGHHYRLRVTLTGDIDTAHGMIVPDNESYPAVIAIHDLFDHKNLSTDIPELHSIPMTTECLSRYLYQRLSKTLPVHRVRLWENPTFFSEYIDGNSFTMGYVSSFRAAHRLHSPKLSDKENKNIYSICNNLHGHGHRYLVETTLEGQIDETSGTLFPLGRLMDGIQQALVPWDYKHLNKDTDDFTDQPSTSENIIHILHPRLENNIGYSVQRLRLWETPNNRFTLRKDNNFTNR